MATAIKDVQEDPRERALQERVATGYQLEDVEEMTPRYRNVLVNTIHIAADLEVVTLPTYSPAIKTSPTLEDKIAIAAACQDELGHAQMMYRILEDFGYDTHSFLFDRAGYITTVDLEENCSYAPFARSLRKVNYEETFHVAHGERWTKFFFNQSESSRKRVQEMVDFYFPLCAAWFGMPDNLKTRTDQLAYRIRGASNDEMRQKWLSRIVPYSEEVGIKVPAHFDEEQGKFVLDYEAPIYLDEEKRQWDYDRKITWEEQLKVWKKGSQHKVPSISRVMSELWGKDLW